jgi:hypothetical protein
MANAPGVRDSASSGVAKQYTFVTSGQHQHSAFAAGGSRLNRVLNGHHELPAPRNGLCQVARLSLGLIFQHADAAVCDAQFAAPFQKFDHVYSGLQYEY